MYLPIPRFHLFEINDQSWFPESLRRHVQAVLAHFWTIRLPILQSASPASLVARILRIQLGPSLSDYTFVDFCAGAGGPTPAIERALNGSSSNRTKNNKSSADRKGRNGEDDQSVDFVLTDLHPHLPAWHAAALQSPNILFVPAPVDASTVPPDLLSHAVRRRGRSSPTDPPSSSRSNGGDSETKQFRLFSLALHHFDDAEAARILRHALRTSSGFGVFELQARTFESMGIMALFGPLMWAASWWWFWRQWEFLFWMYLVPVVPFVVVFDGVVSSLRTRTPAELVRLIKGGGGEGGGRGGGGEGGEGGGGGGHGHGHGYENEDEDGIEWAKWRFKSGTETHTWPLGELSWFVGVKE